MKKYSLDEINELLGEGIKTEYKVDYKNVLNKEQYEAVCVKEGPCLIIAGAGTGKTRTLVHRVSKLIEDGVSPDNILLLTFTKKAANEMEERVHAILGSEGRVGITTGTYHSFGALLLRKYGNKIGIASNFTIADTEDAKDIIDLVKEKLKYNEKGMVFPKAKELIGIISSHINKELSIDYIIETQYEKYVPVLEEIKHCYSEYKNYKSERNILDYDDILVKLYDLLRKNDDLVKYLSQKHQYIMVDEYQDSNSLQLKILMEMCKFGHGPNKTKNLCCVGDEMQSIYGWRGADFRNILNFPNQFEGCKVIILKENYRSTQEILDLSNAVTDLAKYKYDKKLFSRNLKGDKPYLVKVRNQVDESKYILSKIMEYISQGNQLNDIAILCRSANHSQLLEVDLTRLNIPYVKYGGIKFLEKSHIKDLLAYFKIMSNHRDEIAWFRVLRLYEGIGPKYAKKIVERILVDGIEVLNSKEFTKFKYGRHLPVIYAVLKETMELGFAEQMEFFIKRHYKSVVYANCKKDENPDKKIEDAILLTTISEKYRSVESFLTDLLLDSPSVKENEDECLVISTIHSVKGLEYKYVFILSCVEGCFPSGLDMIDEYSMEEALRLTYVAITRAKKELHVMFPETIIKYGNFEVPSLSRFFEADGIVDNHMEVLYVE